MIVTSTCENPILTYLRNAPPVRERVQVKAPGDDLGEDRARYLYVVMSM